MPVPPAPRRVRPLRGAPVALCLTVLSPLVTASAADLESAPLARAEAPASTPLFTPVPAELSGLVAENQYADPSMWGERFQEFKFGAIGTGLAVGDFDNDGRVDLFVVSKTETSRLFRNLGGLRFEDVTEKAGLLGAPGLWERGLSWIRQFSSSDGEARPWSQGASFADVNNDGFVDLYVCRFAAANQLFINQGDGTFREEAAARGLDLVDASGLGAFCDYDRDGWLDVYVQTNLLHVGTAPNGQRDRLFRNTGGGRFVEVTDQAGIRGETQGHSVLWWDYDDDGWPDLYVANDFAAPDSLYRNNRDGTFTDVLDTVVPGTPHSSMGSDLADVNNDGRVDALVADMAATTREKDHRGMAKTRALLDTMERGSSAAPQTMRNMLFLNTGTGRMLEAAQIAGLEATDWTWSVMLHDLDCDGRVDAFFTNGMVRELHNSDLVRRISASESLDEGIRLEKATPPLREQNRAYQNRGDLEFVEVSKAWGLDHVGVSFGCVAADFDGDGDLDLVYANYEAGPTLLRNNRVDGNRLLVSLRGRTANRFGLGSVVRIETDAGVQVRPVTAARGYLSSQDTTVHFGLGSTSRIKHLRVTWPGGDVQTFTDLDVNQRVTVTQSAAASAGADHMSPPTPLFRPAGDLRVLETEVEEDVVADAARQPLISRRFDRPGPHLASADFNADGQADFVLGGTLRTPARVYLSQSGGGFREERLPAAPADDGLILTLDVDGDGTTDLLLTRAGDTAAGKEQAYQPRLFLNRGDGVFQPAPEGMLPRSSLSVGAAAVVDLNNDGHSDVVLGARLIPGRYPAPAPLAVWLHRGGRLEDATSTLFGGAAPTGLYTGIAATDLDGDGWTDLVVAREWGTVTALLNRGGRSFEDAGDRLGFSAAGAGWWTVLADGDLNADGRPDIVAGNVGLNTSYRASEAEPALVFAGDFARNGGRLLLETHWEGGRLYPRRGRNELVARIPALNRRFLTHDAYARADLETVVGREALAGAERYAATEFRSGVFLSQPGGTWRFVALPRGAQLAPLTAIVVSDLTGDGHADILATQNQHSALPSEGRFAGGLGFFAAGDGRGGWVEVPHALSGWTVPGDTRSLLPVDLSRGRRWVVTRSGAPARVFERNGQAASKLDFIRSQP